jgi:hypothetical protein
VVSSFSRITTAEAKRLAEDILKACSKIEKEKRKKKK